MAIAIHIAVLIALCPTLLRPASFDLAPLLPPLSSANQTIMAAVQSGDIPKAGAATDSLPPAERPLWTAILAIIRNDPTSAIRALRSSGSHPKVLGVAYYIAGQHLLFRDQMKLAITADPSDFGPYYFMARHYDTDLDNCQEALPWFRQSLEHKPTYMRARSHLGNCLERLGHLSEAERYYVDSLSLPLSKVGLARIKLAAGDKRSALSLVEQAIAIDPKDPAAQRLAARIYESFNRQSDAIHALELAAAAAPYDSSIHYLLYRAHRAAGHASQAAESLKQYEHLRSIYGSQPQ